MANDDETAQVFDVAQQEREIIDHDGSLFVIGRSGSGTALHVHMVPLLTSAFKVKQLASPSAFLASKRRMRSYTHHQQMLWRSMRRLDSCS